MSALSDLFQDIADAIRGQTGDTAKLSPAAFPAAIAAIEGGGSSTADILPETQLATTDAGNGLYQIAFPEVFALEAGKTYIVEFAGVTYTCEAATATVGGANGIGIGNPALVGLDSNTGEPFLIGVFADGSSAMGYTTVSDSPITVRIYQEVTGASGGDEGWIGTSGTIKPSNWENQTISHNLGAIPDIVMIYDVSSTPVTGSSYVTLFAFGFSEKFMQSVAFSEGTEIKYGMNFSIRPSDNATVGAGATAALEETTYGIMTGIHSVTETKFEVGSELINLSPNTPYTWYAFARKS